MSLRIIGGELRRRHLKTPRGILTRPYTDRVRQIVFDRIADRVPGARVADIYAGVGTMGLEAISRGAASCVFFEGSAKVHRMLRSNVESLVTGVPVICWKTDVRYTSFLPRGADSMVPYSLLFFDPPYADCRLLKFGGVLSRAVSRLARPAVSASDALLLVRTPQHFELDVPPEWQLKECWRLSTMHIWNLVRSAVPEPAGGPERRDDH